MNLLYKNYIQSKNYKAKCGISGLKFKDSRISTSFKSAVNKAKTYIFMHNILLFLFQLFFQASFFFFFFFFQCLLVFYLFSSLFLFLFFFQISLRRGNQNGDSTYLQMIYLKIFFVSLTILIFKFCFMIDFVYFTDLLCEEKFLISKPSFKIRSKYS